MNFKILGEEQDEIVNTSMPRTVVSPKNEVPNINDTSFQKHGRNEHEGHVISEFLQSPPMIFSRDGHNIWFGDMYRGKSAFLVLSGPSFQKILNGHSELYNKSYIDLLKSPGFITMSVNNAISSFRTDLWVSNDKPSQFVRSVWYDPKIMKFCPWSNVEERIFNSDEWKFTKFTPGECPNTWFFRRNDKFNADTFMYEDTFNWGSHKDYGGKRSVMLIALRMLYYLGIRKVFLLGCDFKMDANYTYHFKQERHDSSINSNNSTYLVLKERFNLLKPHFKNLGYDVYNCNPESQLQTFPIIEIDDALKMALDGFPDVEHERTEGLYDREYRIRQEEKKNEKKK